MNKKLEEIVNLCKDNGKLAIYLEHEKKYYCPVFKVGEDIYCPHHYKYSNVDGCLYQPRQDKVKVYTNLDNNLGDC